jgi:hypothetical protein
MIDHKYKFIFVHIPKTGGISISKLLDASESTHNKIDYYINNKTKNYYKFTFVRNPWDRFVSLYNYYIKGSEIYGNRSAMPFVSFEHFVDRMNDGHEMISNQVSNNLHVKKIHYESQISFIRTSKMDKSGYDSVDYLGRFESLQLDFYNICKELGIPKLKLPHHNKTKHNHYTEFYNTRTKKIVEEKYIEDVEYFKYNFGN